MKAKLIITKRYEIQAIKKLQTQNSWEKNPTLTIFFHYEKTTDFQTLM